jgi:outer membrane protein assembly factor BamA
MGCLPIWNPILHSTRVSIGGGLSIGSPMGRCELTYAVPIRYGPRDARKSVQFGFGFSFG